MLNTTVAERAQRAANRKNTCKLRKQLHQFDNTTLQMLNTTKQRNALQIKLFIWLSCEHLQHLLSNWWRCFLDFLVLFYLHVFSEVAACWDLSATVEYSFVLLNIFVKTDSLFKRTAFIWKNKKPFVINILTIPFDQVNALFMNKAML